MPDGRILYLFTSPWLAEIDTEIKLEGGSLLALDTMTGDCAQVATSPCAGGQVVRLQLPPAGHALYVADPGRTEAPPAPERRMAPVKLGEFGAECVEPNVLVLNYCDLEVMGHEWADIVTARADAICRKEHGVRSRFDADGPSPVAVDRPRAPDSGFAVTYRFTAEEGALRGLELALEQPWLYRVEVNGRPVEFPDEARWFDEGIRKAQIGEFARTGENTVTLVAEQFSRLTEIAPAYLLGQFAVRAVSPGFVIAAPQPPEMGDWLNQGLSFYPWGMRYTADFELGEPAAGVRLGVPEWEGSAMRVLVDGREVGAIAYPPYTLETEAPLAAGRHTLSIDLFGNLKNMMGPPFSERLPIAWSWMDAPVHQPDGEEYRFYSCGLMAAPSLSVWR